MSDFQAAEFLKAKSKSKEQEDNEVIELSEIFCTNCGAKLPEGSFFCDECGTKVESEEETSANTEKVNEPAENLTSKKIEISKDRMNAIKYGRDNFKPTFSRDFKLFNRENEKKELALTKEKTESEKRKILGYYTRTDKELTEYIVIENVNGTSISGYVNLQFYDSSYGKHFFEGEISGDNLSIKIINSDLHPLPDQREVSKDGDFFTTTITKTTIKQRYNFSGTIDEGTIAGTWTGDRLEKFTVYKKC